MPYFAFALLFMLYFKLNVLTSSSLNSLPRSAFSNIHNIAREMEVRKGGGASTRKISGARVHEKRARE